MLFLTGNEYTPFRCCKKFRGSRVKPFGVGLGGVGAGSGERSGRFGVTRVDPSREVGGRLGTEDLNTRRTSPPFLTPPRPPAHFSGPRGVRKPTRRRHLRRGRWPEALGSAGARVRLSGRAAHGARRVQPWARSLWDEGPARSEGRRVKRGTRGVLGARTLWGARHIRQGALEVRVPRCAELMGYKILGTWTCGVEDAWDTISWACGSHGIRIPWDTRGRIDPEV